MIPSVSQFAGEGKEEESSRERRREEKRRKRMVGVLSNKIGREELKPGDHIYSWRSAYLYAHHGIFMGDDEVIHFTRSPGHEIGTGTVLDLLLFSSSPASPDNATCPRCAHLSSLKHSQPPSDPNNNPNGGSGVVSSCLSCFLSGGHLYRFSYSVSPAFFLTKVRGGTCTRASSDPPELVLHRARFLLTHGFGAYSLFKNNCEDFSIYCKTSRLVKSALSVGRSGQLTTVTSAISAFACFLASTSGGLAVVTTGIYCVGRYVSDIGIRRDVVKVPVERLVKTVVTAAAAPSSATIVDSQSQSDVRE
jgi:Lecithin retinol acyltransferase